MTPVPRLIRLLRGCIDIIREHGPEPAACEEPLSEYLERMQVNTVEMLWLTPRVSGFSAGYSNGFDAGMDHRDRCLWQHVEEHLESRRN